MFHENLQPYQHSIGLELLSNFSESGSDKVSHMDQSLLFLRLVFEHRL
jgi:hypothetical protein